MADALVEIRSLDFAYGQQLVLKQIDLDVAAGSVVGVIGPNGGGKTTLLRLLLGLVQPTRGTIRVAGLPPAAACGRGDLVGYLSQNPAVSLNMPLDVRRAVVLGLAGKTGMLRPYAKEDLAFAEALLERVGLAEQASEAVGALSGGQLQRLLIARALVSRPKLLLLDEPTTGIDRAGQEKFVGFLMDLKKEFDLTLIVVSHDLRTVSSISDRIACLNLTLHYHDVPEHMPAELMFRMFSCDLHAAGIPCSRTLPSSAGASGPGQETGATGGAP